jgi:hypothetical protein
MRALCAVLLTASLGACAVTAEVRTEVALPELDPPPPPPRVVADYSEPEPLPAAPAIEDVPAPVRPPVRQPRPEQKAEASPPAEQPVESVARPPAPSLTITPSAGAEQTTAAIRGIMARAERDLGRVNVGALNADGRTQYDTARRFLQQADAALKARNIVFAGKLADKAATMAAILVR